ncbi:MAG: AbrB/MazE/SpoVT family DNA-binding domain-containing protein [Nitrospirae bacterium]|uniref:AbrB/MazE/SpoVT family DNA-binding domain-containing protein n=1 Tax=Candidatus Magnetobacterium casense TaxID=1455061 RepID=UPI00058D6319|nr:AbrB/MazE/SpoVT family DNA-binding domain-containing protein [Candidatus Magnetobacterium casensis]MBF0336856.1 AbrB/MazE/SpoVT family DNA-binding domain-containing protein [Nitrospirota bacterium]
MSIPVKITSKGQVTIPKEIRDILKTDVVEFELKDGNVVVKPVESVSGVLSEYSEGYTPFDVARDETWEKVVRGSLS